MTLADAPYGYAVARIGPDGWMPFDGERSADVAFLDAAALGSLAPHVLARERARVPHIPIVALVPDIAADVVEALLDAGAADVVAERDLARLTLAVRRAVRDARSVDGAHDHERRLAGTAELVHALIEHAPEPIAIYDPVRERFTDANLCAQRLFGCEPAALRERTPADFCATASFTAHGARARAGEIVTFEGLIRSATGVERLCDVTLVALPDAAAPLIRAGFTDITERRRVEQRAARLNRALQTASSSNAALCRAATERDLLTAMCTVATSVGGYAMAFIGYRDEGPAHRVIPVASAGRGTDYLSEATIGWDDDPLGRGPTGTAIRTGRPVINRSTIDNPAMQPWRSAAHSHGFRSSIALPLTGTDGVLGALTLYANDFDAFDADEVRLLVELAANIAYGIGALRDRAARSATEQRLRRSMEETIAGLVEIIEQRHPLPAGEPAPAPPARRGSARRRIHPAGEPDPDPPAP